MAVAAIDGENGDRSPRSPRASDAASAWTQATDNVRTIARTLDRFEGWHASKFRTCSDAISVRTLSKSVPGTATPHSVTRQLGARRPFRSLSLHGERERFSLMAHVMVQREWRNRSCEIR